MSTNKSVRVIRHPNGLYEVKYCAKFLGIFPIWISHSYRKLLEVAIADAEQLWQNREEKSKIVWSKE